MFPIRDHNPSQRVPVVTWTLMAVNVLVFLGYWPLFDQPRALEAFFYRWALIPAAVSEGQLLHGLLTSMFLHGGWLHLGGNMLFLWIFGDNVEDEMGHAGFLGFYLAGGLAAALAQYLGAPGSTTPMLGASGAIAAVMGAYLLMFPRARVDVLLIIFFFIRIIALPAWVMLGLWFAVQLVSGVGVDPAAGGVAYWAHAGGFVAGVTLTLPLWIARGGPLYWRRHHGLPPHPEGRYRFGRTNVPVVRRRR